MEHSWIIEQGHYQDRIHAGGVFSELHTLSQDR